jgi:lysozyme
VPTIGWGHTNHLGRQFNMDAVWTQQECDAEFLSDMKVFEGHVHRLVTVPLTQLQFDALVSFAYNCGQGNLAKSTLLKKVNARDFAGAAQEFGKWVKAGGMTLKGLVRRRKYESRLFLGHQDLTYP